MPAQRGRSGRQRFIFARGGGRPFSWLRSATVRGRRGTAAAPSVASVASVAAAGWRAAVGEPREPRRTRRTRTTTKAQPLIRLALSAPPRGAPLLRPRFLLDVSNAAAAPQPRQRRKQRRDDLRRRGEGGRGWPWLALSPPTSPHSFPPNLLPRQPSSPPTSIPPDLIPPLPTPPPFPPLLHSSVAHGCRDLCLPPPGVVLVHKRWEEQGSSGDRRCRRGGGCRACRWGPGGQPPAVAAAAVVVAAVAAAATASWPAAPLCGFSPQPQVAAHPRPVRGPRLCVIRMWSTCTVHRYCTYLCRNIITM